MSVTFNRAQLIQVAKNALTEHEKARKAYDAAVATFKRDHAAEYGATSRERARKLRDGLTKALKSPGPITKKQIRTILTDTYRIDDLFYSEPSDYQWRDKIDRPQGLLSPAQVTETKALLQVLGAATGDAVTANELKLLGLKNLGPVFTAAAGANGMAVGR